MTQAPVSKLYKEYLKACAGPLSRTSLHSALEDERFAEHARWIAVVIATWQRIETQLSLLYSSALQMDFTASRIAWHAIQNHRTRMQTISSALHEFLPDEQVHEAWKELQAPIKKAKSLRDTFAHAQWEANPKKNHVLEMRSTYVEDRFIRKAVLYPLNNIRANAAQVCGIGGDVSQFVVVACRKLQALPRR